jgi:predicted permease
VLLLAAAGTALTAFLALTRTPLNFEPDNLLIATLPLPEGSHTDWSDRARFFDRIRERIAAAPGVENASLSFGFVCCAGPATPPLQPMLLGDLEPPGNMRPATVLRVTPDFLSTLRIPLRAGRTWTEAEHGRAARVAVVAQHAATQLWPGQSPIGQRVRMPQLRARQSWEASAPGSDEWLEVIGVVADVPTTGLREPSRWAVVYVPFTLNMGDIAKLVVRTRGTPLALAPTIQRQIQSLDPGQPFSVVETGRDILRSTGWGREEMVASVLLGVALMGLLLASVGLHSVVSYVAAQRARDFGIRRALGARAAGLMWRATRSVLLAVAIGAVAGVGLSATMDRLASQLAPLKTRDPAILAMVVAVLLVVALAASLRPAWRATRVDPLVVLRAE